MITTIPHDAVDETVEPSVAVVKLLAVVVASGTAVHSCTQRVVFLGLDLHNAHLGYIIKYYNFDQNL